MPEMPEVESLAHFLTERLVGHAIARVELAAFSALKTYDPPPTAPWTPRGEDRRGGTPATRLRHGTPASGPLLRTDTPHFGPHVSKTEGIKASVARVAPRNHAMA